MIEQDSVYLYHLTLRAASGAFRSCTGRFRGLKRSEEIVLANSTTIELWIPDSDTGKLKKQTIQHAFGIIQCIDKIRLAGATKDLLVITSDSGKLVVAEYDNELQRFHPRVQEPHSKSFLRRNTPGEYLAIDPENRALMIASIERNKLVYKVESSTTTKDSTLKMSSPLEAMSKNAITLALSSLDVGFNNPMFAAIEIDYTPYEQNDNVYDTVYSDVQLNYYELDQGLNYITKSKPKSIPGSPCSNIIALPNTVGGILVTCDSFLVYDRPSSSSSTLYVPLPIREGTSLTIIVNHVVHRLPKDEFFVLLQSSVGDLFKLTVTMDEDEQLVRDIQVKYFETIPPCNSINILRSGFLFANVLNNNKMFFQFESLGDDGDDNYKVLHLSHELTDVHGHHRFKPRSEKYLSLVDVLDSLEPIVDAVLIEHTLKQSPDPIKKVALLSSKSYLKELQHGFQTYELALSPLPINATDVFITKLTSSAVNDEYMVISSSLSSQTIVLSIGEDVEEVTDSNFVLDQATLGVQQVGKHSLVQIYANGIRHIDSTTKKTTDWYPPAGIHIAKMSTNSHQVVIALSNFEVVYFEVDAVDDQLIEYQDRLELTHGVSAMGMLLATDSKSPFVIIGGTDETIQVVSLSLHNCLEVKLMQALSSNSTSILIRGNSVHIGMEDGMFVTTSINLATGKLYDSRTQYLGSKPVRLSAIMVNGEPCVLALSTGAFLGYSIGKGGPFKLTPLIGVDITSGGAITSEELGEMLVGINRHDMKLFKLGTEDQELSTLEEDLFISSKQLRFQPKRLVIRNNFKYIIESEYKVKSPDSDIKEDIPVFGYTSTPNSWASCIQVLDASNEIIQTVQLEGNHCALSLCYTGFEDDNISTTSTTESYLIVGMSKDLQYLPMASNSGNALMTFRIFKDGTLKLLHSTDIEGPPTAMVSLGNRRLLVGSNNYLRVYGLGKSQLLRKSTTRVEYLTNVVRLCYQGNQRVVIGDANKSTVFATFDDVLNQFMMFADDTKNRQITCLTTLDYDTVIGGDKFGNVFVNRCGAQMSRLADEYWSKFQVDRLNGSSGRLTNVCEFYVNDVPTSFIKGSLIYGGEVDPIIYTAVKGTVGLLLPLSTKSEVEFLMSLELTMKKYLDYNFDDFNKNTKGYNLLGKDHQKFRGYYNPAKNVIDGDLIERYFEQPVSIKQLVAKDMEKTIREVEKKIQDLRLRVAF
ncbi:pre-mRNA-splicing factor rse1 [Scheffersomyces spartinae]|uniref:Pre-mRNA-splicing factor rse1 n=1 Tax=Scheffersomyces spartinae TaxID=45513 RepID=A0A9P7V5Y6_9ASCO|nr:pre-mRNA-splicing factor rse1 [Scheffersomyces spartinae]KAG7191974.1 pre-mRNA-splicing factor rse1 [Scheffersomyces spartinae]